MCETYEAAARYSAALRVRCNYGMRGFGVYNAVAGLIGASPKRRIVYDLQVICWELGEEKDYVKKIIEDFDLFVIEDGYLIDAFTQTPEALAREEQEERRRRRSEAAKKAAATRKANAELKKNMTPSFLELTNETTSEPETKPEPSPKSLVSESGVPYGDDWNSDALPSSPVAESYSVQTDKYDWETFYSRFNRIRKYWNDLFINSNRPKRAYWHDPSSAMIEYLKKTFERYSDEDIEKAFDYAASVKDFTWELRFAVKLENVQMLLSKSEQDKWKERESLSPEQQELLDAWEKHKDEWGVEVGRREGD